MLFHAVRAICVAAWLLLLGHAAAQVFEVKAGSSSLYDTQGGMLTMHGRTFDASAGMGLVGDRLTGGAQMVKKAGRTTLTLGSENIPFNLPTDIFDNDHYLTGIGVGVTSKIETTHIFAFFGETSTAFNSPFFDGARAEQPAGIVLLRDKLTSTLTASTALLSTRKTTMIESFEWKPNAAMQIAVSGGLGADQLYGASSFSLVRRRFDLKAAYIAAGSQFRRADVLSPITSEPDRENVILTVRPTINSSLSASRQNYLTPVDGEPNAESTADNDARSSVNQLSGSMQVRGIGLSATLFDSTYMGSGDLALAASASRQFGPRINLQAMLLASRPRAGTATTSFVTNVQEELTPRWTLSQNINTSNGQSTVGFGGSFLSNRMTFSAEYQTYYVPERVAAPFQESLVIDARLHMLGRLTLGGGTFVAPNGKLLYTAQFDGELDREQVQARAPGADSVGAMLLRGRVVDSLGAPVEGAALLIDDLTLYTDSDGCFYIHERKAKRHALVVLVHDFLGEGSYRLVTAPATVQSGPKDASADTTIVVEAIAAGTG